MKLNYFMYKKNIFIFSIVTILLTVGGCTKGFNQLNTNPNALSNVSPNLLLTTTLANVANNNEFSDVAGAASPGVYEEERYNMILLGSFAQQFASNKSAFWFSTSIYSNNNSDYDASIWRTYYLRAVANSSQLIFNVKNNTDPTSRLYYAIANILNVYGFDLITDAYGDVPYSQAAKGYNGAITTPVYDPQKNIYAGMLQQLDSASKILSSNPAASVTGDISNNGGTSLSWQRVCAQLMVRIAMRLVRVDPATAQKYVERAVTIGNFAPNNNPQNSFYVQSDNSNYANPRSLSLLSNLGGLSQGLQSQNNVLLSNTYTNLLKQGNGTPIGQSGYLVDPRYYLWPVVIVNLIGGSPTEEPSLNGFVYGDGQQYSPLELSKFSRIRTAFLQANAPVVLISNSQTMLLLAEAALRGYAVNGNSSSYYLDGIQSAINESSLYGVNNTQYIPEGTATITNYITAKSTQFVASTPIQQLQLINTEYWLCSLLNGPEAYFNWRRTSGVDNPAGFPALSVPALGGLVSGGLNPRRLLYPELEKTSNTINYQNAITRLMPSGQDIYSSRMYIDGGIGATTNKFLLY